MNQLSIEATGFKKFRKKTLKEHFLEDMETVIPWIGLVGAIEPFNTENEGYHYHTGELGIYQFLGC